MPQTRTRFAQALLLYAGIRLRNGIERAFLLDGRRRGGYPLRTRTRSRA